MKTSSSSIPPPSATLLFSTVGRCFYGFDVFSVNLLYSPFSEHLLTDGISINYNAHFSLHSHSLVFISERNGSPHIYHTPLNSSLPPQPLPSSPPTLFHDRPILKHDRVYFVSAHDPPPPPHSLYKSWSAVYSAPINAHGNPSTNHVPLTRLSPNNVVDYSPAMSKSGDFMAVASYGSNPWGGEFHQLNTQIVMFPLSEPHKRTVLANRGGWPTWCNDSAIYFHRESEDGWWSIYRVDLDDIGSPRRVTPPGLHAFTPAAMHDGKRIAVATRRKDKPYRHIEIFHVDSGMFEPVTEVLNPELHHYNPFLSPGSDILGYHRFRGESVPPPAEKFVPNLEPVTSPIKSLEMQRINGNFPSFSPDGRFIVYNPDFDANGGLCVMKSDGSNRWTLIKGRVSFYNSWSPSSTLDNSNKSVIFTSLGGIFQPAAAHVQIARVTFDTSNLNPNITDVEDVDIKILTKDKTGNNAFPACSPDGKWVVFRSGRSGQKNLYIMDAVNGEFEEEGGSLRQLTKGEWIDTMPSWSPKGDLIAFSSNRHNPSNAVTFGIYLIRPDGSNVRRIQLQGSGDKEMVEMERANHVCFSPDGEWLLFTANMGGVTTEPISMPNQFQPYGDLFMVRIDGSGLTRLTWNGYENGTPTWHPQSPYHLRLNEWKRGGEIGSPTQCDELKNGQFQEPLWITCDF